MVVYQGFGLIPDVIGEHKKTVLVIVLIGLAAWGAISLREAGGISSIVPPPAYHGSNPIPPVQQYGGQYQCYLNYEPIAC